MSMVSRSSRSSTQCLATTTRSIRSSATDREPSGAATRTGETPLRVGSDPSRSSVRTGWSLQQGNCHGIQVAAVSGIPAQSACETGLMGVDRAAAVRRLRAISDQIRITSAISITGRAGSLQTEAAALVASCLGSDHYLVAKLDQWRPFVAATRIGRASPEDEFRGLVDAAVSLIGVSGPPSAEVVPAADPELWSHVRGLLEGAMWDKVPAAVVTYTEDWFRRLAGNPPNKRGGKLYGVGLFTEVLRPGTAHSLGTDQSEQEGWRDLGQGLAKAIGNGHRHALQNRADAERLAWGVIGLASLLIGEARRSYGDPDNP